MFAGSGSYQVPTPTLTVFSQNIQSWMHSLFYINSRTAVPATLRTVDSRYQIVDSSSLSTLLFACDNLEFA